MRLRKVLPLGIALALVFLMVAQGWAQTTDDAVRQVARQLQCPVCEGQNVADSNAGLARDMRAVIRTQLEAGQTDQQT